MRWQSGQPVRTHEDWLEWQVWRKARKLESQRQRRRGCPRIDYYPSEEALAAIRSHAERNAPVSKIIDGLLLQEVRQ